MLQIVLVGFLTTGNGRSCERHHYGCGDSWIYESPYHGVGMQICLQLVDGSHVDGCTVQVDGSDGCCVCFAGWEYAVGSSGVRLDGCVFRIRETVLPDNENSSKRALFHCNRGYAVTELFKCGPNWSSRNNSDGQLTSTDCIDM